MMVYSGLVVVVVVILHLTPRRYHLWQHLVVVWSARCSCAIAT